ncbi:MAG: hypothetical protein JXL97_07645 [Bacteroidales bacterium]|nr:hypothetical protein [Bacteroidales bacterium]
MRKIIFIIFIVFFQISAFSQEKFDDHIPIYFFGVRIITTNSGVGQYFIIYAPNGTIEDVQTITKNDFLKQAQGFAPSDANIKSENFFTKYGAFDSLAIMREVIASIYPVPTDEVLYNYKKRTRYNNRVDFLSKNLINNLWKLRYAIYPFMSGSEDTLGWTMNFENTYMPRPEQMQILEGYGLDKINGYVWGDNLFRLFKDMQDPNWVETYKKAGSDD